MLGEQLGSEPLSKSLSHFSESLKKRKDRNLPIGKSTLIPWITHEP